ncbi:MAG: four helix bundle protein [Alphaproteobacteria bacterium]
MTRIQDYKDLTVWQKSMQLAEDVFKLTENFPNTQRYVLVAQIQRCALSIPSNIAEGRSRHSHKDFIYHLNIARGSVAELETQIILSFRLGLIDEASRSNIGSLLEEIRRMLFGLRKSLKPETSTLKPEIEEYV